jgi:hypothetical protein
MGCQTELFTHGASPKVSGGFAARGCMHSISLKPTTLTLTIIHYHSLSFIISGRREYYYNTVTLLIDLVRLFKIILVNFLIKN